MRPDRAVLDPELLVVAPASPRASCRCRRSRATTHVAGDALAAVLLGEGRDEAEQAGLAGAVVGLAGDAALAERRDEDEAAEPLARAASAGTAGRRRRRRSGSCRCTSRQSSSDIEDERGSARLMAALPTTTSTLSKSSSTWSPTRSTAAESRTSSCVGAALRASGRGARAAARDRRGRVRAARR